MRRPILIDPHGDDAALFAAFTCLRVKPLVIVTHLSVPAEEVDEAMDILGCEWQEMSLTEIGALDPEWVISPALERDGLPEHNLVAEVVQSEFPRNSFYLTYAGYPRQKSRGKLANFRTEWLWKKLRALAVFESQARTPSWMHFVEDLREYVV